MFPDQGGVSSEKSPPHGAQVEDGSAEGDAEGMNDGEEVGSADGDELGTSEGDAEGVALGVLVG